MTDFEVFPKAPIVEAVLSFNVGYLDDLVDSAKSFHAQIAHRYPAEEIEQASRARFVSRKSTVVPPPEPSGVLFRSEDLLWAVHLTRHSFAVHRLRPYEGWDPFRAEAEELWEVFRSCFSPETVTKISLRYLNRINLPRHLLDFNEYFRTYLELAPSIDTGISSFLLRFTLNEPMIQANALITQTFEPGAIEGAFIPVVFDIDVYRSSDFGLEADAIWGTANQLREYKDRIFFESLTDKAKALFR